MNQILLGKITDSMWKTIHCCQNFTDLKDRHFLPSWQLRATFFLLIQVILEKKNQVPVLFLINKQGEAVKNWNAKIWWNDWFFFMLYGVKIICLGKQSRSQTLACRYPGRNPCELQRGAPTDHVQTGRDRWQH